MKVRVSAFTKCLLFLFPAICYGSYPTGGWTGDWTAEIRPEGCTLETSYKDITAEANPNIDPESYATNDPFRLYFLLSETTFNSANDEFAPGTLFLWLQPREWESIAERQLDIVGASIGQHNFEIHHPAAMSERQFFFLSGESAHRVFADLIADRGIEINILSEQGETFHRKIPLAQRRKNRFRTLSRMLEACYEDRNQ